MSEVDVTILRLDEILFSLLGNKSLVELWWNSKNRAFDNNTPYEMYLVNPTIVKDYILGQLNGDYS